MFPQCYLNCGNPYYRSAPIPSVFPGPTPTPSMMPTPGTMPTPGAAPVTAPTIGPAPTPGDFDVEPDSPTVLDIGYTQGYLRRQIGRLLRVTFLVGTDTLQDRSGILETVGISYIILRETGSNIRTLCDIYSIKFVSIIPSAAEMA
ncbi:hypothetical protein [Clostridium sp. DJ247]|uniref:hypothetical protein n=1 Tax=Clostridium sp. DJ247 TaxID=2726188 RepID=UPI001626BD4D|nr:hypothetical protein [Clostridium sp. DJ247]MBC2582887.1 hypothetical protein [Clostridium sp. DJ247]